MSSRVTGSHRPIVGTLMRGKSLRRLATSPLVTAVLLVGLTIVAAALRFHKLGDWSFWADEIGTVRAAHHAFENGLIPGHIPTRGLSLLIIGPTLKLLGTSEWSARLVPVLFGTVSVPLLFFPIRKLFGTVVAFVTVLFLTTSPWHLFWSQNARYVSALMLFYALGLLLFYIALEEDSLQLFLLSAVFLCLAVWERLFALYFVPVIGIYIVSLMILPLEKPSGLRWKNLAAFILPGVPLTLFVAKKFIQRPALWFETFSEARYRPASIFMDFIDQVTVPIVGLSVIGALYFLVIKKHRASLFLSLGVVVPVFGTMIASLFQTAYPRYTILALPSVLILASLAIAELLSETSHKAKILVLGVGLMLLLEPILGIKLYYSAENPRWTNWRGAYGYVSQHREPGDLVATNKAGVGEYYLGGDLIEMRSIAPQTWSDVVARSGQRIWFVEKDNLRAVDPVLQKWIEDNSSLVYQTVDVLVYLYIPETGSPERVDDK